MMAKKSITTSIECESDWARVNRFIKSLPYLIMEHLVNQRDFFVCVPQVWPLSVILDHIFVGTVGVRALCCETCLQSGGRTKKQTHNSPPLFSQFWSGPWTVFLLKDQTIIPSRIFLVSVSDPWRAFWADRYSFLQGPFHRFNSYVDSRSTEKSKVCRATRGGPRTPFK